MESIPFRTDLDPTIEALTFAAGPLGCNCTILVAVAARPDGLHDAIVIDPGGDAEFILQALASRSADLTHILHTHAHFDHCLATAALKAAFPAARALLHPDDNFLYSILREQCRLFGVRYEGPIAPIDAPLEDRFEASVGPLTLAALHTPGHSPGSACFLLHAKRPTLYAGDTLFAGGIGRTDLWGGDAALILRSIKSRLLTLDGDTSVVPGHGPSTRIGVEARANPFLS